MNPVLISALVAAAVGVLGATDWAAKPRPALAASIHVEFT